MPLLSPMKTVQNVTIYSDGACSGNPGPGGWASILLDDQDQVRELGGPESSTTNNRMELRGVLEALKSLSVPPTTITIYTDSTYLIRGITQWAWGWKKNGWKTSQGDEVQNRDLWEDFLATLARLKSAKVSWNYVRGHQGTPGNERCDEIAVGFSKGRRVSLFRGNYKDYGFDIKTLPSTEDLPTLKSYEKKAVYSYLSLVHGQLRRHTNWGDCERRVKGQSGAKFKKAMDPLQEKEILASWGFDPEKPVAEDGN